MPARLSVKQGPNVGKNYEITTAITIGSNTENTIVVPDTAPQLLEIRMGEQGGFVVALLSSAPSVYVNGEPFHSEQVLEEGDEIAIPPNIIYKFQRKEIGTAGAEVVGSAPVKKKTPGWVTCLIIIGILAIGLIFMTYVMSLMGPAVGNVFQNIVENAPTPSR